jgi:hypothetical protein
VRIEAKRAVREKRGGRGERGEDADMYSPRSHLFSLLLSYNFLLWI